MALVRLLFTAAAFVFGAGVVVYVFLWLTMPVGDPVAAAAARLNVVRESPLSRGNAGYGMASADDADVEAAGVVAATARRRAWPPPSPARRSRRWWPWPAWYC